MGMIISQWANYDNLYVPTIIIAGALLVSILIIFIILLIRQRKHLGKKVQRQISDICEKEERLELVIEGTNIGMWDWYVQTGTVVINERWAEILGRTLNELTPFSVNTWFDLCHPDDLVQMREILSKHFAGETKLFDFEYRMKHKDNHWVWVQVRGRVADWTSDKKPLRMTGTHLDISEKKRVDELIWENEEKYRAIFSTFVDLYYKTDLNGTILVLSPSVFSLSGYTPEELIGKNVSSVYADPENRNDMIAQLKKHGRVNDFETVLLKKNGIHVPVSITSQLLADNEGRPIAIQGSIRDITKRKQTEEALRVSKQATETILQSLQSGVMIVDTKTHTIIEVNPAACELIGGKRDELVGHKCHEFVCPAEEGACPITDKKTTVDNSDHTLLRIDGTAVPILKTIVPITLGDRYCLLESFVDISARKQMEVALRKSETQLRAITDSAQDAIFMTDPEGLVEYWNPAAERILGFEASEIMGQTLRALSSIDQPFIDLGKIDIDSENTAAGKTLEMKVVRKDGREIMIELSLATVQLNNKYHTVGTLRDVTVIRQAERDLVIAKKAAENANNAKSEFLANMSHEIRTPMNGIIGMVELLLATTLAPEQRYYAEIVRTSAESLLLIINDLLDFSKIEAGKFELENINIDLRSFLDEIVSLFALRAQEKKLDFICTPDPDVPMSLIGDPGRLRQILTNLIGNALKFTSKGEITIGVSLASAIRDNNVVLRFSVRDTGIGIPKDRIGLLFEPFSQVDASTTREYGGTGLGLAISKRLARLMGGEIGVNSTEGKGSEFWITTKFSVQHTSSISVKAPKEIQGIHILIVDPNNVNRNFITTQLRSWGARVTEASEGFLSVQKLDEAFFNNDPFTLAIIDMQLPGNDAEPLIHLIKNDRRFSTMYLLLMTSLGSRVDVIKLVTNEHHACITKPIRISELSETLSILMSNHKQNSSEQSSASSGETEEINDSPIYILVAEDNLTNQLVVVGILKKLGYDNVTVVSNGAEAIRALERYPYDLIFMDIQMPEMDGLEAARHIRDRQSIVLDHKVPIIAMTAHAMHGDRERCLNAGMNDYLPKPITPNTVCEVLQHWAPKNRDRRAMKSVIKGFYSKIPRSPEFENDNNVVFDRAGLLERVMDDEKLMREIIDGFIRDTPNQIDVLQTHIESNDLPRAQDEAHGIKGSSGIVGGEAMCRIAFEVEKACKTGNKEKAFTLLQDLRSQFDLLKNAMQYLK